MTNLASGLARSTKRDNPTDSSSDERDHKRQKSDFTLESFIPALSKHDPLKYTVLKTLSWDQPKTEENGENVFGTMNLALEIVKRTSDSRILVRKIILAETDSERKFLEIRIQRSLDHKNIVPIMEAYAGIATVQIEDRTYEGDIAIVYTPLCDLDTLDHFLSHKITGISEVPEAFYWHALKSVLEALIYCQTGFSSIEELLANPEGGKTKGWTAYTHNDVHAGNIFLTSKPDGCYPLVQLADFGLATPSSGLDGRRDHFDVQTLLYIFRRYKSRDPAAARLSWQFNHILELTNKTDIRTMAQRVKTAEASLNLPFKAVALRSDEQSSRLAVANAVVKAITFLALLGSGLTVLGQFLP